MRRRMIIYLFFSVLTVDGAVGRGVEADEVVEVGEGGREGVELVGQPEVGEAHVEQRRAEDAAHHPDQPEASLVPEVTSK